MNRFLKVYVKQVKKINLKWSHAIVGTDVYHAVFVESMSYVIQQDALILIYCFLHIFNHAVLIGSLWISTVKDLTQVP